MLYTFFAEESCYFAEKYINADEVVAFCLYLITATSALISSTTWIHKYTLFLVFIEPVMDQDIQQRKNNKITRSTGKTTENEIPRILVKRQRQNAMTSSAVMYSSAK